MIAAGIRFIESTREPPASYLLLGPGEMIDVMSIGTPRVPGPAKRISHEGELLAHLRDALADLGVECVTGQSANNKFGIDGWGLSVIQQFQFGDLRIEVPNMTVLVETESAGGVGNLVKYWPLLRSRALDKRIVLIHLYMLGSDGDYIAHRKLWSFLVDRMETDLNSVGIHRPDEWDTHLFTYRKSDPPDDVTAFLRMTVAAGLK